MSVSLEHLGHTLPLLPYLILVDNALVSLVLVTIVLLDLVYLLLIDVALTLDQVVRVFDRLDGHSELLGLPVIECSSTIASPEHASDALQTGVLLASQRFVTRELFDVLEPLVPDSVLNYVSQCPAEGNSSAGMVFPAKEESPALAHHVVLIVAQDQHADVVSQTLLGNFGFFGLVCNLNFKVVFHLFKLSIVVSNIVPDVFDVLLQTGNHLFPLDDTVLLGPLLKGVEEEGRVVLAPSVQHPLNDLMLLLLLGNLKFPHFEGTRNSHMVVAGEASAKDAFGLELKLLL